MWLQITMNATMRMSVALAVLLCAATCISAQPGNGGPFGSGRNNGGGNNGASSSSSSSGSSSGSQQRVFLGTSMDCFHVNVFSLLFLDL